METPRRGDWMQTHSGLRFYPLDPRPEDIRIEDIAHALSHICRFNGHCARFYSVAEHSIMVAREVYRALACHPRRDLLALTALLHDASEAYLCDVPRPLKRLNEMTAYRDAERQTEIVLAEKFGLIFPLPALIKHADERALMTERRDLVPNAHLAGWTGNVVAPFEDKLDERAPDSWAVRLKFLALFEELGGQRG